MRGRARHDRRRRCAGLPVDGARCVRAMIAFDGAVSTRTTPAARPAPEEIGGSGGVDIDHEQVVDRQPGQPADLGGPNVDLAGGRRRLLLTRARVRTRVIGLGVDTRDRSGVMDIAVRVLAAVLPAVLATVFIRGGR